VVVAVTSLFPTVLAQRTKKNPKKEGHMSKDFPPNYL
jgi:hypothetical protein